MHNRIKILFRWSGKNMYTLAVLLGLLDDKLPTEYFEIGTIEDLNDIKGCLKERSRVIIAYSFSSPEAITVRNEVSELRSAYGNKILLIAGGPHASAKHEETLKMGFDTVFTGESEVSFPDFLRNISEDFSHIPAFVHPLPMDDFDDYPPFAYKRDFFAPIEIRRGCASRCLFCQTHNIFPEIRERSVRYSKKYMEYIKTSKRYNAFFLTPDALSYGSENGIISPERLEFFLKEVRSTGVNVHLGNFPSEISPRSLSKTPECAAILKKYVSNTKVIVGGQSGSDHVLGIIGRNHSTEDITRAVGLLRNSDFTPIVDIMLGVPGETHADRKLTVKFMRGIYKKYSATFNIHHFIPIPGTAFENSAPEHIENSTLNDIADLVRHGIAHSYP